jgi:hypothetical protein
MDTPYPALTNGPIAKLLRAHFNSTAQEPLPKRWVELINYLKERERVECGASPSGENPPKISN